MEERKNKYKIKILEKGPYLVTGGVPLTEKIIAYDGEKYEWKEGRELPQSETYTLCRCGKSKNHPFCDGNHVNVRFKSEETASREPYKERAKLIKGPKLDLLDDGRCAFVRFCHRKDGDAWELVEQSDNEECRQEAIIAASDCSAGRLTAVDKEGNLIEPELEPGIEIVQDPARKVSACINVKGYIPIESSDGHVYEIRNRVALCRCGKSKIKPFCDGMHVLTEFKDK
ncbi:MAG: CDGSH iron-sulfur domain-containing protein [Anaerovoracaceae bacterium]|jgi:CDGSH-type Zn-finger protein